MRSNPALAIRLSHDRTNRARPFTSGMKRRNLHAPIVRLHQTIGKMHVAPSDRLIPVRMAEKTMLVATLAVPLLIMFIFSNGYGALSAGIAYLLFLTSYFKLRRSRHEDADQLHRHKLRALDQELWENRYQLLAHSKQRWK